MHKIIPNIAHTMILNPMIDQDHQDSNLTSTQINDTIMIPLTISDLHRKRDHSNCTILILKSCWKRIKDWQVRMLNFI